MSKAPEQHRLRQREEAISTLMQIEGDDILRSLGREPGEDGEWSEDDIAALYAEASRRVPIVG